MPRQSSRFSRRIGLALALSVCTLGSSAYAQSDTDRAAARSLATQGADAFKAGKYDEAIDLLTRAEALLHAPTHLLLTARAQVATGKLVVAKENYLKITREQLAADAPNAFRQAQEEAKKELAALEPRIASLKIVVSGDAASAEVTVDGQPVSSALLGVFLPADPGKHKLTVAKKGEAPTSQDVTLAEGEKKEITLKIAAGEAPTPPPVEPPPVEPPPQPVEPAKDDGLTGMQIGGLAAAGVGLGGVAVGVIFILGQGSTQSDADSQFDECNARGCTADEQAAIESLDSDAASKGTIGVIGLAAGGALIAAGATLFFIGGNDPKHSDTAAQITPWIGPNGGGIAGRF